MSEDMIATLPPPQAVEPEGVEEFGVTALHLLFYEDFSTFSPIDLRFAGQGFARGPYPGLGLALNLYQPDQPVYLQINAILDVAVEARFVLDGGAGRVFVRLSDAGSYSARLDAAGLVELYRGEQLLSWAQIAPGEDRRLRLEAVGDRLAVVVDSLPILQYVDPSPLPAGGAALMAQAFIQNGALVDEIGVWSTEPQAPAAPVFAVAPLSGTPTPVFLPAPLGLPDYTTLLISQNEAFYAGPQPGLYNQPLHFVDRNGEERQFTILPGTGSGYHGEIIDADLEVSPDGAWAAVVCGGTYDLVQDICVISLSGDDAGKIKPLYSEMNGGDDAYSDTGPRWFTDSGGLWIVFNSTGGGLSDAVRRVPFSPEEWRTMVTVPTTPPQNLSLNKCADVAALETLILCANRDSQQPGAAVFRFNPATGQKETLLSTTQLPSPLRDLDAVTVAGGERIVSYVLSVTSCYAGPGCAIGWFRFSSDSAFTPLSGSSTSFQNLALYRSPRLNPEGSRVLVEQYLFGGPNVAAVFNLTSTPQTPVAVTINRNNYLGVD